MDKVTFDFENNTIEWNTEAQQGTESCPELSSRKREILKAAGYDMIPMSELKEDINEFLNKLGIDSIFDN